MSPCLPRPHTCHALAWLAHNVMCVFDIVAYLMPHLVCPRLEHKITHQISSSCVQALIPQMNVVNQTAPSDDQSKRWLPWCLTLTLISMRWMCLSMFEHCQPPANALPKGIRFVSNPCYKNGAGFHFLVCFFGRYLFNVEGMNLIDKGRAIWAPICHIPWCSLDQLYYPERSSWKDSNERSQKFL